MTLSPGTRLGPYAIQALLGRGGTGEVYLATDTRLARPVAIKLLSARLAADPIRRQRLEREARAIAALKHPHICTLYDVGRQNGLDFLVMEYLEGESLADRLAKRPLRADDALRYAAQVASALDAAHRAGIVHGDVKPANIVLIGTDAKLLDFGLASSHTAEGTISPSAQTQSSEGVVAGTLHYMAPEQVAGEPTDARSDIFALGIVLYEMLTRKRPFEGTTRAAVMGAILEYEPPPLPTDGAARTERVDKVVRKCLAKDPWLRWQTAHDLADELRWIAEADPNTRAITAVGRTRRKRVAWMTASAFLLLSAGLAIALYTLYSRHAPNALGIVRFLVFPPDDATFAATGGLMAVSPDGNHLAYLASPAGGKPLLWLRSLDSPIDRPLAGTEGAAQPFWSPDSRFLAFTADGKLKKIAVSGGAPQTLCDGGLAGTWNRDGVILFSPNRGTGLYRVSANGGIPTPITTLDESLGETDHLWPQFLPDDRHFVYLVKSVQKSRAGIYLGSLDSAERRPLVDTDSNAVYAPPGYLLFRRRGTLVAQPFDAGRFRLTGEPLPLAEDVVYNAGTGRLVFAVSQTGVLAYRTVGDTQLIWFGREGKRLASVAAPGKYTNPALSPDEKRVAVARLDPRTGTEDVWLIDLARGVSSRFTFDPAWDTQPVWSPDGGRIVFGSNRRGQFDFYQKRTSGAAEDELLFASPFRKSPLDWSRDGRFIMYRTTGSPMSLDLMDLWVLPLFGDRKPSPFLRTEFSKWHGQLSPDGRWLAYVSEESGIASEVFVRSVPTTEGQWQISANGGDEPRWRGDGKELFYLAADGELMAVPVNADASFNAGTPRALFQTDAAGVVGGTVITRYCSTADGQRFLINTPVGAPSSSPITVVLNWTAELNRR